MSSTQNCPVSQFAPVFRHWQRFEGVELEHSQRPEALQTKFSSCLAVQSAVTTHCTQVSVAGSQVKRSPPHGASVAGSHIPHAPVLAHTVPLGLPAHSGSPEHPRQVAVPAAQIGVVPLHPS